MCLFVFKFLFVENKVFDGVLMDVFHEGFDGCFWEFKLVSLLMECSCMAPLMPNVMITRGLVFQPLFCMVLIRGSYLVCLLVRAWSGYRK